MKRWAEFEQATGQKIEWRPDWEMGHGQVVETYLHLSGHSHVLVGYQAADVDDVERKLVVRSEDWSP